MIVVAVVGGWAGFLALTLLFCRAAKRADTAVDRELTLRSLRVSDIKSRLASGDYSPDDRAIADAVLRSHHRVLFTNVDARERSSDDSGSEDAGDLVAVAD